MMTTRLKPLMAALLVFFSMQASAASFESEQFTLKNGLHVVVLPNHKVPAVTQLICYHAGAMDDPYGKSGLAHYLEHLMFKGTARFPKGQFTAIIAKHGGNDNAFTSHDYTAFYQTIAVSQLPLVMELEADRMQHLVFDAEETRKEKEVILEERSERIDNDPGALLSEQMQAALYLNHQYHRPVIGWRHEMVGLTPEDANNFYQHYYAPNNATLIVSGDITAAQLKPLAEKYYGTIPPHLIPAHITTYEPPAIAARRVILRDNRVHVPQLVRYYMAPNSAENLKQSAALTVLSYVLGEGDTSRLYHSLVEDKGLATNIDSSYDGVARGPVIFSFAMALRPGQDINELEKGLDSVLQNFLKNGITEEELTRAKNRVRTDSIYSKESFKTLAFLFGHVIASGLNIGYVEHWEDTINQVTIDDVNNAAKQLLVPEKSVTGQLLSAPTPDKGNL